MTPTIVSQKQRKPRRDKLSTSEKQTRHQESSRNYYARYYTEVIITFHRYLWNN